MPARHVPLDAVDKRLILQVFGEAAEVEADGRGMRVQSLAMKHAWIAKQLVVHLPEFPLPRGSLRGSRGQRGPGVLPTKWKVTEYKPQRAAKLLEIPNEQRKSSHAVQTLEIRVLNERDERVRLAAHVVNGIGGHGQWRPAE